MEDKHGPGEKGQEPRGPSSDAALSAALEVAESAEPGRWDSKAAIPKLLEVARGDSELLWDAIGRMGEARANNIGFMTWVGTATICAMATRPPLASFVARLDRQSDPDYDTDYEVVAWKMRRSGLQDQTPALTSCRSVALQFLLDSVPGPTRVGAELSVREAIGQALASHDENWGAEAGQMTNEDLARFKGALMGAIERRLVAKAARMPPQPALPRPRAGL